MSTFYKVLKSLFLLSIAGIFLYFSYKPDEYKIHEEKILTAFYSQSFVQHLQQINLFPVAQKDLDRMNSQNIVINYPQKSMQFNLREVGVYFDNKKNQQVDSKKFEGFNQKVNQEISYLRNAPNINLETNEFYELGPSGIIKLNDNNFLEQISFNRVIGATDNIRILPTFDEEFSVNENIKANEELRKQIVSAPLSIKAGRMVTAVTADSLNSFIEKKSVGKKEVLKISTAIIEKYLMDLNEKNKFPTEVNYKSASTKLANFLLFRLTEEKPAKTFILPINGSFSIDPYKHPKFIEVNKSQQRAYLFENGILKKTLYISTGVTWETPAGTFNVLNKVPMTISYTNSWYMPWYLPIGQINGKYYVGFHEVPYHMDYNGMIYSRDPETIGSPATGGCIQVLKGQAKELFDWAEVGMPVYITE